MKAQPRVYLLSEKVLASDTFERALEARLKTALAHEAARELKKQHPALDRFISEGAIAKAFEHARIKSELETEARGYREALAELVANCRTAYLIDAASDEEDLLIMIRRDRYDVQPIYTFITEALVDVLEQQRKD